MKGNFAQVIYIDRYLDF